MADTELEATAIANLTWGLIENTAIESKQKTRNV
jgi:hypothetical protein